MKFKAIIFDLDGVICFTDEYHYRAWKALADRLNAPFDRTINNRLRGVSRMASLEIVLLSEEEKAALATEKNEMYRESLKEMSPADLSDEVRETLDALRAKGLKLAIGSSSKNTRSRSDWKASLTPSRTATTSAVRSPIRRCSSRPRSSSGWTLRTAWWSRTPSPAPRPDMPAA